MDTKKHAPVGGQPPPPAPEYCPFPPNFRKATSPSSRYFFFRLSLRQLISHHPSRIFQKRLCLCRPSTPRAPRCLPSPKVPPSSLVPPPPPTPRQGQDWAGRLLFKTPIWWCRYSNMNVPNGPYSRGATCVPPCQPHVHDLIDQMKTSHKDHALEG